LFFDKVLLIGNGKKVTIGNPVISDALVSASIVTHLKGDKVKVFKKKRRKGYQILKGHRQLFTEILINEIFEKGGSKARSEAASQKPVKETVARGKKVKESEVKAEVPAEQAAEAVAAKGTAKKPVAKATGKTKIAAEKKTAPAKKEPGSKTGRSKVKEADAEKSEKKPKAPKKSKK
jgi:large subunit ribosomal protein L21